MNQPKTVKVAIILYFAAVVLSIIGAIPNYLAADPRPSFFGVLITWSIIYGLFLGLGYAIKIGKNWARHVNAVITTLSLASTFMFGTSTLLSTEISQIMLLINSMAMFLVVILLYTPTANQWFKGAET